MLFREKPTGDLREHGLGSLPPDSQNLLQARIKDLKLHLSGTPLEKHIHQLYAELDSKGLSLRPQCYLSDQWGCPSGVPVIGIPFYLADPQLHTIEAEFGAGAESEREIMMYLRHEAGHCFNYAYVLDHYRQRNLEEKVDVQLREQLDQGLCNLFEAPGAAPAKAETLIRAERQSVIQAVTQYSGVSRAVVRSVVDHLTERASVLGLTVHLHRTAEYLTRLTSLVTTLAMNYLYTDRFFEVE